MNINLFYFKSNNALNCLSILGFVSFLDSEYFPFFKHSCPMESGWFSTIFYLCKHSFGWLTHNRSQRVSNTGSYLPTMCSGDYLCSRMVCPLWSLYEICFRDTDITKPTKRTWIITRPALLRKIFEDLKCLFNSYLQALLTTNLGLEHHFLRYLHFPSHFLSSNRQMKFLLRGTLHRAFDSI